MSCWNCGTPILPGAADRTSQPTGCKSSDLVCSTSCLKNLMMNPSILEIKESKILCERDHVATEFADFVAMQNLPPLVAADISWAQTIFSTHCIGEYFKSDEYPKFIEKNVNKSFDAQNPAMLRAVAVHELFETLHSKSANMVPRYVRAQAVLKHLAKSVPLQMSHLVLLNTEIFPMTSFLLSLGRSLDQISLHLQATIDEQSPKAEALSSAILHQDRDRPVWMVAVGLKKTMAIFDIQSAPSANMVQLNISFTPWLGIKFNFDKTLVKDITVGMMRKSLMESYPVLSHLGDLVLLDPSKQEVLSDSLSLSALFNSAQQQITTPQLVQSIEHPEDMVYKELINFQVQITGGSQIQYYVWADVECKCSDLLQPAQRMLSLMGLSSPGHMQDVKLRNPADADKTIRNAVAQVWSGSGAKPKRFDLHSVVPLTVSQVTQVDEQMLKTLKSIQAIKDFRLVPRSFTLWQDPRPQEASPAVLVLSFRGDHAKETLISACKTEMETNDSSTPEVAQGKYCLHAILLKNQDVVETVILKGEGFKTITEPEKNYKYWSNRHGEQDGPLTDAISKAFALVYELRTCNDD